MQQNRTLIFIDLKILFEPMFVIAGTLCYVGTLLLHLCLMRLMFCMLLCMLGFDDFWCMYGAINCMLRVFDPSRLLVVRVGNLDDLKVSQGCSCKIREI